MDEIEKQMSQNFQPLEQNFHNMEVGLKWLWGMIYNLMGYLAIPLEKAFYFFFPSSNKDYEESDWL